MTTEEKAKAYDVALEKAKELLDSPRTCFDIVQLKNIFPQFRENEDERIMKILSDVFADSGDRFISEYERTKVVSWLEKQKQKPDIELIQRSWYMEGYHDREFGKEPMWLITACDDGPKYELNPKYGKKLVEEQKPAWSEEDEKKIGRLRSVVNQLASYTDSLDVNGDYCEGDYAELDTWLKSLRPCPSWKPSEEQIAILWDAISNLKHDGYKHTTELISLYERLKKL